MGVVWGRCRESEGAPPLWPWTAELRTIGIDPHRLDAATDATARFRQFEEIADALAATTARDPLVVVLDDVHRAGELSLRLLAHLGDASWPAPLGLLVTYRDHEVGGGGDRRRSRPPARRAAGQLGGLGLGDVAALLDQAAIDGPTLSAAELLDRTAGNPLFVTELLCLLADGGPADCMPASVGEVAMTRLAALPAATRQALELAAVLGRDFDHAVLAAAMRASPEVALEALDAAVAAGLVTSDRSASFRFVQAVVRDAVASQLPPSQRAAAHHAVHAHEVAIGVRLEAGDDQRGEPAVVAESRRTHPR